MAICDSRVFIRSKKETKYIKENYEMVYQPIKKFNGKMLYEKNACKDEFEKFVKKYGFHKTVEWNEENEKYFKEQNGWIDFLIKYKFIKKIVFNQNKLYFLRVSENNKLIAKLVFVDEHWRWVFAFDKVCQRSEFSEHKFDSAQRAVKTAPTLYNDCEVFGFDSIREAVDFFFPLDIFQNKMVGLIF